MNKIRNIVLYFLVLCVSFVIGAAVFDRVLMPIFVRRGRAVAVPDLVGLSYNEAKESASDMGFRLELERDDYSDNIPQGSIMSQLPIAGSLAKRGRHIWVVRSLGAREIEVPDLRGETFRHAKIKIQETKLTLGNIEHEYSDVILQDNVIRTNPLPGTKLKAGDKVDLVVSLGSASENVSVPNFIGMNVDDIQGMMKSVDLKVSFTYRRIPSIRENTVYKQSVPPGTKLPRGSLVTLLVSQGTK